jgi:serine protease Do
MTYSSKSSVSATRQPMSKLYLSLTAMALFGTALGAVATQGDLVQKPTPEIQTLKQTGKAFTQVTKHVSPAVVFIKAEKLASGPNRVLGNKNQQNPHQDEWMEKFFGDRLPKFNRPGQPRHDGRSVGQGSGFVITENGYILTNSHVVKEADKLTVTMADGREFEAKKVGSDSRSDVAVIKVDASDLPVLRMGDSEKLQVGEWALAIGSPFGLSGSVTAGIVSATGRNSVGITDYENFIQTDAAINPGNSGGPLVNLSGEVIGINTAIFSRTGANNGIGFAIPINMAHQICDQLIEHGSVTRGHLGIMIQNLTPELAKSFGLGDVDGVLIGDVVADSPAHQAGLEAGDLVVEFNGKSVDNMGTFRNTVAALAPETKANIVVLRDGNRKTLSVTIGQLPSAPQAEASHPQWVESLGFTVQPLSDELRKQNDWQDVTGVVIDQINSSSSAALAGLQPGMLIEEVNRQKVDNVDEFHKFIEEAQEEGQVLFRVKHGEYSRYVTIQLQE